MSELPPKVTSSRLMELPPEAERVSVDNARTALVFVGVFVAIGGFFSMLLGLSGVLLKLLLWVIASNHSFSSSVAFLSLDKSQDTLIWLNAVIYFPAGVALLVLGIGTARCRRWARMLMESLSALMTLLGVVALVASYAFTPVIEQMVAIMLSDYFGSLGAVSPGLGATLPAVVIMLNTLLGIFYIGIPAWLWWFYRRPATIAVCMIWDKKPTWLDRCPGMVLSLVIVNVTVMGILPALLVLSLPHIGGVNASVIFAGVFFAGLVVATVGLARMRLWGWIINFALLTLGGVYLSGLILTHGVRGIIDWYLGLVIPGGAPAYDPGVEFYVGAEALAHFVVWGSILPLLLMQIGVLKNFRAQARNHEQ